MVPSLRKAGLSLASDSAVVSGRLCSSLSNTVGPLRPGTSTAAISASNLPAACAALKRCCERSAQRSWSSRLMPFLSTRSSVCQPECLPLKASFRPSYSMLSKAVMSPMRAPQRPCGSRYGARSMFSMPPAMAQSIMPAQISSAALATPCAPDPQTRLTVSAGTSTGSPAAMPA